MVHQVEHQFFQNHAQAARAHFAGQGLTGDGMQGVFGEFKPDVLKFKQALILLGNGVLGPDKDFDQCGFIQVVQDTDDRQTSHKLGYQAELDQVQRLALGEQFGIALGFRNKLDRVFIFLVAGAEAHGLLAHAAANNLFQPYKGASADKQDVGRVYRGEFLVRMLAATLRRNVGDGAFQNLQQRLLHAFAGDVARDRGVLVLAADLIYFINVDDAGLGTAYIAISRLQQLEDDVFYVLTHVPGFGEGGGVYDGKGDIEHARQGLRQQRLAGPGWSNQQNIAFGQLHFAIALAVHVNALVVVVDRDRQFFLGLLLADDVFVEEYLDLLRFGQMVGRGCRLRLSAVVFQNRVADGHALVADIGPRIIAGRRD